MVVGVPSQGLKKTLCTWKATYDNLLTFEAFWELNYSLLPNLIIVVNELQVLECNQFFNPIFLCLTFQLNSCIHDWCTEKKLLIFKGL
jgi:hypothetical protein